MINIRKLAPKMKVQIEVREAPSQSASKSLWVFRDESFALHGMASMHSYFSAYNPRFKGMFNKHSSYVFVKHQNKSKFRYEEYFSKITFSSWEKVKIGFLMMKKEEIYFGQRIEWRRN